VAGGLAGALILAICAKKAIWKKVKAKTTVLGRILASPPSETQPPLAPMLEAAPVTPRAEWAWSENQLRQVRAATNAGERVRIALDERDEEEETEDARSARKRTHR
jgi:hypothetical protein